MWHTHGGPTPTSLQKFYIYSFWGCGGHVRLMKWKNIVLYQISLSHHPKNHWLWITVSLNHEKMFVWNASIRVGRPCIKKIVLTAIYDLEFQSPLFWLIFKKFWVLRAKKMIVRFILTCLLSYPQVFSLKSQNGPLFGQFFINVWF